MDIVLDEPLGHPKVQLLGIVNSVSGILLPDDALILGAIGTQHSPATRDRFTCRQLPGGQRDGPSVAHLRITGNRRRARRVLEVRRDERHNRSGFER